MVVGGDGGEGRENISLHVIYFSSLDGCLIQFISANINPLILSIVQKKLVFTGTPQNVN